jgi:hypothetical protein
MVQVKQHKARIFVVSALSSVAALSGMLVASAAAPTATQFKGSHLQAEWDGFARDAWSSYVSVDGTNGKIISGRPQPVNTAWAQGEVDNTWSGTTDDAFQAAGDGTTSVSVKQSANSISGNLNTSIPGSLDHWDVWSNTLTSYEITANINASESSQETFQENSITVSRTHSGWVRVHQKGTTSIDAAGSGGVSLLDDNGDSVDVFSIPNGTPTSSGGVSIVSDGSFIHS